MKRTSIYLTERQLKEFEKLSKKIGLTTAELIRRVLDAYLDEQQKQK